MCGSKYGLPRFLWSQFRVTYICITFNHIHCSIMFPSWSRSCWLILYTLMLMYKSTHVLFIHEFMRILLSCSSVYLCRCAYMKNFSLPLLLLLYIWHVISMHEYLVPYLFVPLLYMWLAISPISMCECHIPYWYGHYALNSRLNFLLTILIIAIYVLSCHMLTPMISVLETTSWFSNSILFLAGKI